ncbi:helix-turn-helix domain-containing protein [Elioraea rosea]|uniref:helix-turn-helix domain-containing protein n=1 Tax=Elioraea rosea TaxID=2492390 RepID=UPI00118268FD|nr:helix-turn-helix transcriptional regulator [Elioraea rosea]
MGAVKDDATRLEAGAGADGGFGETIRHARLARAKTEPRAFTLRQVAARAGVQPDYLSRIERGLVAPPGEEAIARLADVLGEDRDVLLALAGKVSADLRRAILRRPKLFAELIRELNAMPDHAILRIAREVRDGEW